MQELAQRIAEKSITVNTWYKTLVEEYSNENAVKDWRWDVCTVWDELYGLLQTLL